MDLVVKFSSQHPGHSMESCGGYLVDLMNQPSSSWPAPEAMLCCVESMPWEEVLKFLLHIHEKNGIQLLVRFQSTPRRAVASSIQVRSLFSNNVKLGLRTGLNSISVSKIFQHIEKETLPGMIIIEIGPSVLC